MKNDLTKKIREIAKEKRAIILAHNYQVPEVQDIADLTGDSLELSIKASKTDAEIIVFCGVRFMAETAAIVSPKKKVLLPVLEAGCEMADMITADALKKKKAELPGLPVVTYVNSTAEVKAESYICCTSANAVQVVKSLDVNELIMTPDKNLAMWAQRHTDKTIHIWQGFCPIHDELTIEEVKKVSSLHPNAILMAHPECSPEVIDMADAVRSTSGMLAYAKEAKAKEFIVATENGLLYPLRKQNPDKIFYEASPKMVCKNMKKTGLEDVLAALTEERHVIKVPEDIRLKALMAVERMMVVPRD